MTSDGRVSFYAGGRFLRVPAIGGYGQLIEILIDESVDYLVLAPEDQFKIEQLVERDWVREIHQEEDRRGNLWRTYAVELKEP
jgi:hypothetical protein